MPAPKMKQVINFGGLAASSASAEDAALQDQEPVTANEQADEPQITVPSLTAQLQPEAAAADTASTEVKEPEAAETQTPAASANDQLDLEDVTRQASVAGPAETATAAPAREQAAPEQGATDAGHEQPEQPSRTPSHEQARVIRRAAYVPAAAKDVGSDDEMAQTAAPASPSRPSLLNRFSGIWSSKPADQAKTSASTTEPAKDKPAAKSEPVLSRADVTLPTVEEPTIMDLPAVDVVQPSLPVTAAQEEADHDVDLDIPAFLRRQAN